MKYIFKITAILLMIFSLSCSQKVEKPKKEKVSFDSLLTCCPNGAGLLSTPVNLGLRDTNVTNNIRDYETYIALTPDDQEFKDHAPFVEINPNDPLKERLWFTSSRVFTDEEIITNLPQQLMYVDRDVPAVGGICPSKGWDFNNIKRFKTGNNLFDQLVKGAVTIAGNEMIVSASHIENYSTGKYNYYNDLYYLERQSGGEFNFKDRNNLQNNVIDILCSDSTWESQPTLSKDGNHLFFVSNRPLEGETKSRDMNIFYAQKDNNGDWLTPKEFKYNTEANEETPQISPDGKYLYFATDKSGNYEVMVVEFVSIIGSDEKEKHIIGNNFKGSPFPAEKLFTEGCDEFKLKINDKYNQRYPHIYHNPENRFNAGNAIFWASDNPQGYGNYDIYGCALQMPCIFLEVHVLDAETGDYVNEPVVDLLNDHQAYSVESEPSDNAPALFRLEPGQKYKVKGGSNFFGDVTIGSKDVETRWLEPKVVMDYNVLLDEQTVEQIKDTSVHFDNYSRLQNDAGKVLQEYEISEDVLIDGVRRNKITSVKKTLTDEIRTEAPNAYGKILIEKKVELYGKQYSITGPDAQYSFCDNDFVNKKKVTGAEIPSEKSRNGYIFTPDQFDENIKIIDTVYLSKCTKEISTSLTVYVLDACDYDDAVKKPVVKLIEIENGNEVPGSVKQVKDKILVEFPLELDKEYKVYGGSEAQTTDFKNYEDAFIHGYMDGNNAFCPPSPDEPTIYGPVVPSVKTGGSVISTIGLTKPTKFRDTVLLVKNATRSLPCKCISLDKLPEHENLAWFQTAFWEVNLPDNLKDHMERLEKGFDIQALEDCYRSGGSDCNEIIRKLGRDVSDYYDGYYNPPMFPINKNDGMEYSLSNARWIELHPNSLYWGIRPKNAKSTNKKRITDLRPGRIKEYEGFAQKAQHNLNVMSNVIVNEFLPALEVIKTYSEDLYKDIKLLVQVEAISDPRPVTRGWYVGDKDINYISAWWDPARYNAFSYEKINIKKQVVNENTHTIINRTNLGKTNIVLSDLRAYYGYKEVLKKLKEYPEFKELLDNDMVFLPDEHNENDVDNKKVLLFTKGFGDKNIAKLDPYPDEANPFGTGYKSYDDVRRIDIHISVINYQNGVVNYTQWCDGARSEDDCDEWTYLLDAYPEPKAAKKKKNREIFKTVQGYDGGMTNEEKREFIENEDELRKKELNDVYEIIESDKKTIKKKEEKNNKPTTEPEKDNEEKDYPNVRKSSSKIIQKEVQKQEKEEKQTSSNKQIDKDVSKTENKQVPKTEKQDIASFNNNVNNNRRNINQNQNNDYTYSIILKDTDSKNEAIGLIESLASEGFMNVTYETYFEIGGIKRFKVMIKGFKSESAANQFKEHLQTTLDKLQIEAIIQKNRSK